MEQDPTHRRGDIDADSRTGGRSGESTEHFMLQLLVSLGTDLLTARPAISFTSSGPRRSIHASSPSVEALDRTQVAEGGPSVDASTLGNNQSMSFSTGAGAGTLARLVGEAGYSSIHAFPLGDTGDPLGALTIYARSARLSSADATVVEALARAASAVMARLGPGAPALATDRTPRPIADLAAMLGSIGAGNDELFLRYFAIGGTSGRTHVDAVMAGQVEGSADDMDTIEHAVDELVSEHRRPPSAG